MKRPEATSLRVFSLVIVTLFLALPVFGQLGQGVVTGTAIDPSGAVVPNVTVVLTNSANGAQRTATTNETGVYRFDFADVGAYTVKASSAGFSDVELAGVVVTVGQTVTADLHLQVGKATVQTITVEAGGVQLVNTTNDEVSTLINRTTIANLPLEARDTTVFVNLVPGSVPNDFNGSTRGASINGMRGGMGNFMIDGTDNNDYGQGGRTKNTAGSVPGGLVSVSPEAVQEFSVVTSNFSAEYGRQGGFVTDLVLKSGTNSVHGSVFEYNRNSKTTADDFFSAAAGQHDQLIRNQFGGSLGGPLKKDKMFVFGAAEFQRLRQTSPFTTTGVRQQFIDWVDTGGLAQFYGIPCETPSDPGCSLGPVFKSLDSKYPLPRATGPVGATDNVSASPLFGGTPYTDASGNPVPEFGQVTFPNRTTFNENRLDFRYDYNVRPQDTVTAHYLFDDYDTLFGIGGDFANPAFPSPVPARAQNIGLGWTHIFSPTVLNETKASYLRNNANFPALNPQVPSAGTIDPLGEGFGASSALPQFFTENTFQYQDNLSLNRGKHSFKLGGEYRRTRNGSAFEADVNGLFEFWDTEDLLTDGAVADLLTGGLGGLYAAQASINPSSPTPALPNFYRGFRANELGWYLEDQWKATSRLTVNLGVRYDYFGPPHNYIPNIDSNLYFSSGSFNQCVIKNSTGADVCYPGNQNPTGDLLSDNPNYPINPFTAAVFGGTFQVRNHEIWNKDTNNFAPRFGIAWDVGGNHKTIIRTGGGIFYDRMYNNIFENLRFNPPYFSFATLGFAGGTAAGPISTPGLYGTPYDLSYFASGGTPSPRQMDSNLVAGYSEQVNFDVQREFANNWVLDTAYIGTFGHKLLGLVDVNTFDGREISGVSHSRINPNVGGDNMRANWFNSNYHALQVKVSKRFSHGFQFDTNYTYSHALDYQSDVFNGRVFAHPMDNYNRGLDYGAADFDLRQRWVAYGVWDLPAFKTNRWLGGWSLDGTFSLQSGSPFSIVDSSSDTNQDGYFTDRAAYAGSGSPMSAVTHSTSPANGYIGNTSAFVTTPVPASTGWTDGLLARNVMTGPKYYNMDLSVTKAFKLTEKLQLKVLASAFNTLNHPNFALPVGDISNTGQFGKSLATIQPNNTGTGARVIQFGARLDF